jgi:hypothetical protein
LDCIGPRLPAQDHHIRLRHLRDRFTTATSTAAAIPGRRRISDQTVRNRLREAGTRARRPVKAVVLTRGHCHVEILHHSASLTVEHAAAGFHHNKAGLSNSLECAPTLSFQYAIL